MKFWLRCALLVVFVSTVTFYVKAEEIAKMLAKVNDMVITSADLDSYCKILTYRIGNSQSSDSCQKEDFRKEALRRLIEDTLILSKAKQEDVLIPDSLIEGKLNQMITSYPSREEFQASIMAQGLTVTLAREKIKEQYLMRNAIDRYVKAFVSVSPQEISNFYNKNMDKFILSNSYIFYIANSDNSKNFKKIRQLIKKRSIIDIVSEYEKDFIKVESSEDSLRKEFFEVLSKLKEGEYKIEKIEKATYILYLQEKIGPRQLSLAEVNEKIYERIWAEKFKKQFEEWVSDLKESAMILNYYE